MSGMGLPLSSHFILFAFGIFSLGVFLIMLTSFFPDLSFSLLQCDHVLVFSSARAHSTSVPWIPASRASLLFRTISNLWCHHGASPCPVLTIASYLVTCLGASRPFFSAPRSPLHLTLTTRCTSVTTWPTLSSSYCARRSPAAPHCASSS